MPHTLGSFQILNPIDIFENSSFLGIMFQRWKVEALCFYGKVTRGMAIVFPFQPVLPQSRKWLPAFLLFWWHSSDLLSYLVGSSHTLPWGMNLTLGEAIFQICSCLKFFPQPERVVALHLLFLHSLEFSFVCLINFMFLYNLLSGCSLDHSCFTISSRIWSKVTFWRFPFLVSSAALISHNEICLFNSLSLSLSLWNSKTSILSFRCLSHRTHIRYLIQNLLLK